MYLHLLYACVCYNCTGKRNYFNSRFLKPNANNLFYSNLVKNNVFYVLKYTQSKNISYFITIYLFLLFLYLMMTGIAVDGFYRQYKCS